MPDTRRGTYRFEAAPSGNLADVPSNVEALRTLWLGRDLVDGADLGPGDAGDTDNRWARKAYRDGTPEFRSRVAMAAG